MGRRGWGAPECPGLGGWSQEGAGAGRQAGPHDLGGGQEGWQSRCRAAVPPLLPSHPTSAPSWSSDLDLQNTSLSQPLLPSSPGHGVSYRGLRHQPPHHLWALWLLPLGPTVPSPHGRWMEPALGSPRSLMAGMNPGLHGPTHLLPTDLPASSELTLPSSHLPFQAPNAPG